MKILWVCNIMLPVVAQAIDRPINNAGGWLVGLCNDLLEENRVDLTVCFPMKEQKDF